jgi:hypothetical protein
MLAIYGSGDRTGIVLWLLLLLGDWLVNEVLLDNLLPSGFPRYGANRSERGERDPE